MLLITIPHSLLRPFTQVSFGLDPMEGVSPRQSAKEQGQVLKEAFAAWSRLRSAQIRLTSAEFVRSTRVGQQPAQGEAGNHKDKLFEAGEGGVAQQYKGRRLHQDKSQAEFDFQGLHAVTQEGGNGIEAVTLDDKGNAPTKRQVPAIRHKAEGAELQVRVIESEVPQENPAHASYIACSSSPLHDRYSAWLQHMCL